MLKVLAVKVPGNVEGTGLPSAWKFYLALYHRQDSD
jgi:hypothetical protein